MRKFCALAIVFICSVSFAAPSAVFADSQPPVCSTATTTQTTGTSGSQTYSTPGAHTFTVPNYTGTLTVEVWGGGGAAPGAYYDYSNPGQLSSWNTGVIANGGKGGGRGSLCPAVGGSAAGGDTNLSGANGGATIGGTAPHGGAGGTAGMDGSAPGGGGGAGSPVTSDGCAGASGAYTKKTYTAGALSVDASITIVVGAGGTKTTTGFTSGARGTVKVTWTSSGQTLSVCAPGYVLKNGKCVSTATCQVCPAGQTLNAQNQCVQDTTCPAGFTWDAALNKCVIDEPLVCPVGATLVGTMCTCPAGEVWDPVQNLCIPDDQCPVDHHWNGTSCVPNNCPAGQHWSDSVHACIDNNCPAGQTWNGTSCVPNNCPAGQHWSDSVHACIDNNCPAGQTWNGTSCVPNNCPAGQHWSDSVRACIDNNCPAGQTWNGSGCTCPSGTVWYQNQCQVGMCVPGYQCGQDDNTYLKNLQCELSLSEHCDWGCQDGVCLPAPAPHILTWKVAPSLVRNGATAGVYWDVLNVTACTVSGTNGDSWTDLLGNKVSAPLTAQTIYTLHCIPFKGAAWTDQTAIVNIVPVFQER